MVRFSYGVPVRETKENHGRWTGPSDITEINLENHGRWTGPSDITEINLENHR